MIEEMLQKIIGGKMNMTISNEQLIDAAISAIDLCFVCSDNTKKRYGCAVLTEKGNIYKTSQYSSFNHITNIHAEMGAIYLASMNNDPLITKLVLVCSENVSTTPASCGICLQFIHEHVSRTKKDIEIIYSSLDKTKIVIHKLDDLLPIRW